MMKESENFLQKKTGEVIDFKKAGNRIKDKKIGAIPGTNELADKLWKGEVELKSTWEKEIKDEGKEKK